MHVLLTCGGLLPKSALGISVALTLVCSIQAVSNVTAGLEVDLSYREASSAPWTWAAHSEHTARSNVVVAPGQATGPARRLQDPKVITNELDYTRTSISFTFLDDVEPPLQCQPTDCQPTATGIYAGVTISQVEIIIDPDTFNAPAAKLRVVYDEVDRAGANLGQCRYGNFPYGAHSATVNQPWSGVGASTITLDGSMQAKIDLATFLPLTFKMGGIYHLCYSDDGSFDPGHTDIVPQRIEVYGIYDTRTECAEDETCLTKRPYKCFLRRQAFNNMEDAYDGTTSCVIDYSYDGAGFRGLPGGGRGSWTGEFATNYDSNGMVTTEILRSCGSSGLGDFPAAFLCNADGQCGDLATRNPYIVPDPVHAYKRMNVPPGRPDLQGPTFKAYAVAACYCPDFQRCDSFSPDYVQQVGLLYFFATKVCPNGFEAVACALDFTGAAPQHRFALKVECPSTACTFAATSRIKVVMQEANNNLPAWDPSSGCGAAVHGVNALGVQVLPSDDNPDVATMNGGMRQDYKIWNFKNSSSGLIFDTKTSGFQFRTGPTDHELRSRYSGETFDVCFCDGGCTVTANWFKVGQLRFAPFQPVSAASNVSVLQDEFILEYMNTPGTFGFYRPWVDYGVMGLQEGGALKLVSDPDLTMTDEGCVSAEYSRTLVDPNTLTIQNAATAYSGKNNAAADVNKLMFNNAIMANTIIVNQAGFVAVCYCARPVEDTPGVCAHDQWVMVNRLTIRGPGPGQSWTVSTNVVFRIEYSGWGLAKDDKVRIIPATSQCSDVNGNPRAAWGVTSIKVGCPHPCSEVGEINDVLNGDISVGVLSSDSYMCDIQNEGCRTNDIKAVTVMDEFTTELEFEASSTLSDGDLITLGENFICAPGQTDVVCNHERLSVLRGRYDLADRLDNHNSAPNEYIAGHAVTVDPTDSKKVTIRVGWPDPKPQFTVQYINNRRGRWQRHSKAITAEEIMGEKERIDMKVCWKYTPAMGESGPAPRHVAEVGTLTMLDPNAMSECLVSLTTLVKKQMTPYAPMILSFRTATAETGKRYESLEGRMRLRIYFVRTVALRATFTDGAIIEDNQGEDELNEARQYICGKLFREVWSSDEELGFPMPRGCYYRTYGQTQELNMLFDRKNGLSPGKYYQVVLMGVAMDEAIRDGEYVHIFTTDDVDLHPYIALERGIATLYRSPQDPAYGSQGVKFAETDGVKISSGSGTEMLELKGGTELRLELKGDPLGGGISASAVLRLYLWPLTQWNVANACTVMCIAHDQVSAPCGAVQDCKGDAIIPNFQQNFLRIVLPSAMATMTEFISHTLVLPDLVLPTGGFFSTRLAAQISKADDTKPHYTVSSGDYIYKMHDEGVGVGKLVEFYGDGDQSPYRGDDRNILYANLVLPSTLFAAVQTGDAYMTLTLPTGYECVRTPDINGESPWRAEDDLGVFQGKIPQGTGSPDEGGGTRGWSVNENQCVYTLRQNAVIYAGSSLYIRVTANNPDTALQRMDPTNRWQVSLTSRGYHQYEVTFPPVTFNTVMQNFSSNTAVLGKIKQPLIVPSNWMYSEGGVVMAQGFLNIFFRSEQGTGVESSVHVEAPAGFSFSPNPCRVQDLEDVYYATPGQMGSPTHRLPGIVSCDHRSFPYNHAAVKLTGAILSNSIYAFGLWVSNAEVYADSQRTGWRIYTLDMNDFKVDGTPMPIPALAHTATSLTMPDTMLSFGLYRAQINTQTTLNVQVSIESTVPYTMSMQRTWVTVLPLRVGEQITSTLRVAAPMGYEWDFANSEFRHLAPFPNTTESLWLMGTTGTLPGRYPQRQGNVLLWNQARMYWPNETYGFQTYIRVPDRTPSAAPNWFIFEFGFDGNSLATRHAASAVPAPAVQSLTNAAMEYNTNVEGKVNPIVFQIQTISQIPAGGGLLIEGPVGFEFPNPCTPEVAPAARGATYQVEPMAGNVLSLPMEVACSYQQTTGPTGRSIIRLTAGASGIMPGLYRFQLLGKNPATAVANSVDNTKPCVMQFCWDFHSLRVIGNVNTKLDSSISIPSFDINVKMVEALIPELTREQQAATGRDDRPLSRNPLVFKFKLGSAAIFSGTMLIRGPLGTIFREDCAEDVEVRPTEVFGTGQMLPEEYAVWPQGVEIVSCRGEGPDARIVIDPGVTDGLLFEVFYPIRVAVLHNPVVQPIDNRWTLDFNGESSDPFDGYMLWTFTRTSLLTATMGRSTTVTGDPFLSNPVTFTFRPKNTVKGAGMIIRVEAPDSWTIAIEADGHCKIMMQPISADSAGTGNADPLTAPAPNWIGPPSLIWGDADVRCDVDVATGRILTATVLASEREIEANRDYQLTIFVRNPTLTIPAYEEAMWNVWHLDTFDSPGSSGVLPTFRDSITLPGYPVYNKARQWVVRNQDPVTGATYRNGLSEIPGLFVQFQLPTKLVPGDVIAIEAPTGFNFLTGPQDSCADFRWEPMEDAFLYLPNSMITCIDNMITIQVQEPKNIPELRVMMFRLTSRNPAKTPHTFLNHWSITHTASGSIMSTEAIKSWDVVPQLANVRVMLVGEQKAENSVSTIAVSYRPVSDADELSLEALEPTGFDFTGASAISLGHEVIATDAETIRIRASTYAEVNVDIVIANFRLGLNGGPTLFNLITRLNNGAQMDEALNFRSGFRLPGRVAVTGKQISSEYKLMPELYPVPSLWEVRMGEFAVVELPFTVTINSAVGNLMRLRAPPYDLQAQDFNIIQSGTAETVTSEVTSTSSGEMVVRLGTQLFRGVLYEASVRALTPRVPNPTDAMWSIEILDGSQLPLNTNDGLTEGFRLVERAELAVRATRSPPMAAIDVNLVVDPKSSQPDELILVAPLGFNFTPNCLVTSSFNRVTSCQLHGNVAGRASARLTVARLTSVLEQVVIKVTTPAQNPPSTSWFINARDMASDLQLAWGEDPSGVLIRQMLGAHVLYPGIPQIPGQMAFSFITNEKIESGGAIRVGYPTDIEVLCNGLYLSQVAITGEVTCMNFIQEGYFELRLDRPLPPGQQAFTVTSTCPAAVNDNVFYIIILTPTGQVSDAAMSIPGLRIQHGLPISAMPLIWGMAEPNRNTFVSTGIELLAELPLKDPPIMSEIIIEMPPDFSHQVQKTAQLETLTEPLPRREGGWLDVTDPRRLRLLMDEEAIQKLAIGSYRFQWPIMVPAVMPKYNIWELTVCSPAIRNESCTGSDDPRALVSFPLAGFGMGESHPSSIAFTQTGDASLVRANWSVLALLAAVAWRHVREA